MSRSVIIPTSFSSSVIGSEPMSPSRISRAASTTDTDGPIERGSSVMASRTLFVIVSPLVSYVWLVADPVLRDRDAGRRLAVTDVVENVDERAVPVRVDG